MPNDPADDMPPDMNEPEPQAREVSTARRPLFPAVKKPPVGATPLLELIFSVVTDERLRDQIEQAAWSLKDGNDEHLLTKAAALFSGIQQAHEGRAALIFTENRRVLSDLGAILSDLGTLMAERDLAGQQQPPDDDSEPGTNAKAGTLVAALRPMLAAEVNRAVVAAREVNTRNLKIACGACFLLGIIACALFVHIFH